MAHHPLVNLALEYVPDIARIHSEALSNDFLPSLGLDFLQKEYYPAALKAASATTLVALAQAKPVGFVTIAHDSERYTREILHNRYSKLALYAVRAALHRPSHLLKSAEVLWSSLTTKPDDIPGEIVFIAVDEDNRGQGIGKRLVEGALEYLKHKNVSCCRTKTLAKNTNVIAMYEKMGWQVQDRFRFIGNEYVTIITHISLPR